MNKHILIIAGLLIANQSFADIGATNGVPDAATCNSGVLDTESGGVALQAQYIPETINLQWYDNNTLLNVTSTNSDSCTYGTGINLPDNPTKIGYKFTGWKVRPQYDFSTIPTNQNSNDFVYAGKGEENGNDVCWSSNIIPCNSSHNDLNRQEWKVGFSFGVIYGQALCSNIDGWWFTTAYTLDESNTGSYCWCKATGYIPNNSDIKYKPSTPRPWVSYGSQEGCQQHCPGKCAYGFGYDGEMRESGLK